jgi:hypothetical protein
VPVPNTENKWVLKKITNEDEFVDDMGQLASVLTLLNKNIADDIEEKKLEDNNYIVLNFENVRSSKGLIKGLVSRSSNFRVYINSKNYFIKMLSLDGTGVNPRNKSKVTFAQKLKFDSYNTAEVIKIPSEENIFDPKTTYEETEGDPHKFVPETHKNKNNSIKLEYPEEWFVKEHDNKDRGIYQLFLSKEKVDKPSDVFLTGVTIMKVYDAKKTAGFKAKEPKKVCEEMLKRYLEQIKTSKFVVTVYALNPIKVGKEDGFISELRFTDKYGRLMTGYHVYLYKDDTLVTIVMESMGNEFDNYRRTFSNMLENIQVF